MNSYVASVNGFLIQENEATVSIFDRGFTLADGVFETMVANYGHVFRIDQHIDRLENGCKILAIDTPKNDELKSLIIRVLDANKLPHSIVRVTVTRGYDRQRGLTVHKNVIPTIVIRASSRNKNNISAISIATSSIRRNEGSPISNIKSLSYVDGVMAKQIANRLGYDDALLLNNAGNIACATSSNIFLIKNNYLITPPLSDGLLEGVTRSIVLESAISAGLIICEKSVDNNFNKINEVFITNIVNGIVPVISIDGFFIGDGTIGPASRYFHGILNEMMY